MTLPLTDRILGKIGIKTEAYKLAEAIPVLDRAITDARLELAGIETPNFGTSETRDSIDQRLGNLMQVRAQLGPQRNIYGNGYGN